MSAGVIGHLSRSWGFSGPPPPSYLCGAAREIGTVGYIALGVARKAESRGRRLCSDCIRRATAIREDAKRKAAA